jgi:hypothetical protein
MKNKRVLKNSIKENFQGYHNAKAGRVPMACSACIEKYERPEDEELRG